MDRVDDDTPDEEERADAMRVLHETFSLGMPFRVWMRRATRRLEDLGYDLEGDDEQEEADVSSAVGLLGEDHPAVRGGG
jgi:hypothetical protein